MRNRGNRLCPSWDDISSIIRTLMCLGWHIAAEVIQLLLAVIKSESMGYKAAAKSSGKIAKRPVRYVDVFGSSTT